MEGFLDIILPLIFVALFLSPIMGKGKKNSKLDSIKKQLEAFRQELQNAANTVTPKGSSFQQMQMPITEAPSPSKPDKLSSAFVSMEDETQKEDYFSRSRIVHVDEHQLYGNGGKSAPISAENRLARRDDSGIQTQFNPESLLQAVIMSEVLAKPKALKSRKKA